MFANRLFINWHYSYGGHMMKTWQCKKCGLTASVPDDCVEPLHNCKPKGLTGLGDVVAKVTSAVGVKPCGKCKERQAKLNKLVPFKRSQ